ncbi:hypothetical protein GOB85_10380 [Acetobacter sp. LMG 1636]|uniref:Transposase n=1 Tax=Acetobacter fallax TaxID=1737473 RepID=A0ABX0KBK4_9PROT|nr:hypothetical protein [Acetobacter fallax]NHO36510.1 hypothetical protein [Acetobacter fallax]
MQRVRRSGSVAPDKTGGSKPRRLAGAHRDRLIRQCVTHDFTLRGLVGEPGDRGLRADYRSVRTFVHDEKLSFKKRSGPRSRIVRMSRGSGHNGNGTNI